MVPRSRERERENAKKRGEIGREREGDGDGGGRGGMAAVVLLVRRVQIWFGSFGQVLIQPRVSGSQQSVRPRSYVGSGSRQRW
ncbi:hypothetical protein Hanom_Chr07g00614901 [Helianthus anomalus]